MPQNILFGFAFGSDHSANMPDDADLLCSYARNGDEGAFRELVQRRFGLVYAVALRQVGGDEHRARDVAQQVFAALARQAAGLSERVVITGWLYRTARFVAIDAVRVERRRQNREQEAQAMQDLIHPAADPDWEKLRPVLDEALSELRDADRDAIMLRIFEERPFADIAAVLRVSEDAARRRVDRALEKLRVRLQRRGVTSTGAALVMALPLQASVAVPATWPAAAATAALAKAPLAGAAMGAATFMSATKTIVAVSGVLGVLALGFGVHRVREARRAGESAAVLAGEIASLQAVQERRPASPTPAATGAGRMRNPVGIAAPSDRSAAELAAQLERIRENYENVQRARASDADYRAAYFRALRADFRLGYMDLYATLGLTPAQIEAFEGQLVERAGANLDLEAAVRTLGLARDDGAAREMRDRSRRDFEGRMRALLGDAAYAQFADYERLAPVRGWVSEVAREVYFTGTPLTAAQGGQLAAIVERHDPHLQNPGHEWRTDGIDWEATVAEARAVLTLVQLAAWQRKIDRVRWTTELIEALNRK